MEEKIFTATEMLDIVLEWFAIDYTDLTIHDTDSRRNITVHVILPGLLKKFPELNSNRFLEYFELVLERLVKDDYLTKNMEYYSINLNGKLFNEAGGYTKKQEIDSLKADEIRTDLLKRRNNDRRLICGTFLAGIGALALVAWDMYKTYYLHR